MHLFPYWLTDRVPSNGCQLLAITQVDFLQGDLFPAWFSSHQIVHPSLLQLSVSTWLTSSSFHLSQHYRLLQTASFA